MEEEGRVQAVWRVDGVVGGEDGMVTGDCVAAVVVCIR